MGIGIAGLVTYARPAAPVGMRNLAMVFPEKSARGERVILRGSVHFVGRQLLRSASSPIQSENIEDSCL